MERIVDVHIERLPEGVYLAPSEDIPGLVAQGRAVTETLEIARDWPRGCWKRKRSGMVVRCSSDTGDSFDYPPVVGGY